MQKVDFLWPQWSVVKPFTNGFQYPFPLAMSLIYHMFRGIFTCLLILLYSPHCLMETSSGHQHSVFLFMPHVIDKQVRFSNKFAVVLRQSFPNICGDKNHLEWCEKYMLLEFTPENWIIIFFWKWLEIFINKTQPNLVLWLFKH